MVYIAGEKVSTPDGLGTVVYCRMAAPNYSEAAAYSVCLESQKNDPDYVGTIFPANQVTTPSDNG